MSRTNRNIPKDCYRIPKTFSERKLINSLKNDPDLKELGVHLPNRYNRWIPTSWDDTIASAWYELHKSKWPD
jgi:hypothetical protein